jgi:hypothetical protein
MVFVSKAEVREIRSKAAKPSQRVKREPISHQGIFTQGEVIDLT